MSMEYRLQFFAEGQGGEKTEPATEKKLSDARKEGQVAKSREIANGLGLLALFLVLRFWIGIMAEQFLNVFSSVYNTISDTVVFRNGFMPQNDMALTFRQLLLNIILIMGPVAIVGVLVAFLSDVAQVGWKPTAKQPWNGTGWNGTTVFAVTRRWAFAQGRLWRFCFCDYGN